VVWNLLVNAIKFTPRGGRVGVELRRVNSHVEIAVSDTGEGIDPEILPQILRPFPTGGCVHDAKARRLGLGLSIVRPPGRIARRNGARRERRRESRARC
jgi:signal transduction histidine kinase